MGAIVSKVQFDRVMSYIDSAKAGRRAADRGWQAAGRSGARRTASSSSQPCSPDVNMAMRIAKEEIFGPVLGIFEVVGRGEDAR